MNFQIYALLFFVAAAFADEAMMPSAPSESLESSGDMSEDATMAEMMSTTELSAEAEAETLTKTEEMAEATSQESVARDAPSNVREEPIIHLESAQTQPSAFANAASQMLGFFGFPVLALLATFFAL